MKHFSKFACLLVVIAGVRYIVLPARADSFAARGNMILDWVNSDWPNLGQYDGPHRIGRTVFWYVEGRLLRNQTNSTTWSIRTDAIRNADGQVTMIVGGAPGYTYAVQASTNLFLWTTLITTNPPALPFVWTDAAATNFSTRFYRVLLGQ